MGGARAIGEVDGAAGAMPKVVKKATRMQGACLTSAAALREYVEERTKVFGTSASAIEPKGRLRWDQYPADVRGMRGVHLNERTMTFEYITAAEYTDTEIHMRKSAWLVGRSGAGKSTMQGAWGRMFCRRRNKLVYFDGKSIDPIGLLTKDGQMDSFGALMLADFNMRSLMDRCIDDEGKKSLFQVDEAGHLPCRYHQAILPKYTPRVFSCNTDVDEYGRFNVAHYFEENHLQGLAALARQDMPAMKRAGDNQVAISRRCVAFVIPDDLNLAVVVDSVKADMQAMVSEQIDNERRFLEG